MESTEKTKKSSKIKNTVVEEAEEKKHRIDAKKLIIYSEILKPKFDE